MGAILIQTTSQEQTKSKELMHVSGQPGFFILLSTQLMKGCSPHLEQVFPPQGTNYKSPSKVCLQANKIWTIPH